MKEKRRSRKWGDELHLSACWLGLDGFEGFPANAIALSAAIFSQEDSKRPSAVGTKDLLSRQGPSYLPFRAIVLVLLLLSFNRFTRY